MVRMPAVVISDHRDCHVTNLGLAREFGFLQIGHANHVRAPTAIYVRLGLGRKLWTFHADIRSTTLGCHSYVLAGAFYHSDHLAADWIAETDMGYDPVAEKRVHAVPRTIEKLVGNYEVEWLVLFLERTHRRHRHDALDAKLFESVNVGAEIQFGRQQFVSTGVTGKKRHLPPFQCAKNVSVGGSTEGSLLLDLLHIPETRHVVQATAADDADLCLRQTRS